MVCIRMRLRWLKNESTTRSQIACSMILVALLLLHDFRLSTERIQPGHPPPAVLPIVSLAASFSI
jgi:hypothetical protein